MTQLIPAASKSTPFEGVFGALRAFEDAVRSGDFPFAEQRLGELTKVLDAHWGDLAPKERAILDESVKAGLNWARSFVAASREQMRSQLESIAGAKVYQMAAPRKSSNLSLVG